MLDRDHYDAAFRAAVSRAMSETCRRWFEFVREDKLPVVFQMRNVVLLVEMH